MKTITLLLSLCLLGCGKSNSEYAEEARKRDAENKTDQQQVVNKEPEPQKKLRTDFETLDEAIEATKPDMSDFNDLNLSKGALIFAYWATEHLKWVDLQNIKSTKHALVMKDPDSARGQKICFAGTISEIQVDKGMPNKVKIYLAGMLDDAYHVYRFIAIGSSGDLVAESRTRFCGIVTGKNDYQNSIGGMAHAVHLVGMFDLPENK